MKKLCLTATVAAFLLIAGCREKAFNENAQSAEDNAQLETEFAQIHDMVADLVATDGKTAKTNDYVLPSLAKVEFTDITFDDGDGVDLTIDFGPLNDTASNYKGILCKDGRYRAGKLRVGINKRYSEIPHILTIATSSSELYYVGNGSTMHQVTGSMVVNRTSATTYTVEVNDATLKRQNGTANWNSERTVTLLEDAGLGWWGDKYEVTGSASGNNANGENFTATITSPLVKEIQFGCLSTFVSGTVKVTTASKELQIDYDTDGKQTCDRIIKVSSGGKSKEITLF